MLMKHDAVVENSSRVHYAAKRRHRFIYHREKIGNIAQPANISSDRQDVGFFSQRVQGFARGIRRFASTGQNQMPGSSFDHPLRYGEAQPSKPARAHVRSVASEPNHFRRAFRWLRSSRKPADISRAAA